MTFRHRALVLMVLCLAAPVSARADTLVGQWHLDSQDPSCPGNCGPSWRTPDSSGNGLSIGPANIDPIQLTGDGRFGSALAASNPDVLIRPATPVLQPDRLTVVAWVRHSGYPGNLSYLLGEGDNGATCTTASYALYTAIGASEGLAFYVDTAQGVVLSPMPGSGLWDGQWHMVAGTFDGSKARLYVDGTEVGSGTPAPGDTIDYALSGQSFYIDGYPPVGCGSGRYNGDLDEVRVYQRALSATEIGRLASATGSTPPVLVPDASDVQTSGVEHVTSTSAQIIGTIDDHGSPVAYHVDYGTTTAYGQTSDSAQTAGVSAGPQPVVVTLTGLSPDTDYHARLATGSASGGDIEFRTASATTTTTTTTTPPPPPTITGISSVGASAAPGTPAIVTADLSGSATEVDWTINGRNVICPASQPTLMFRPAAALTAHTAGTIAHPAAGSLITSVTARAIGAGGIGSPVTQQVAYAPAPTGGLSAKSLGLIDKLLTQAPVYQCTIPSAGAVIAPGETLERDLQLAKIACLPETVIAQTLRVRGCFVPIGSADDVPAPELATVLSLARQRFGTTSDNAFKITNGLITRFPLFVNGVQLTPSGGAAVVLDKDLNTLLTSNASVKVGGIPLQNPRSFQLNTSGTAPIDLGSFARGAGGTVTLGGLGLEGDVRVVIDPGDGPDAHADIATSIQLPAFLGGGSVAVAGRLGVDGKFEVDSLQVGPINLDIPGLGGIQGFQINYANGIWHGQVRLCIIGGACLSAAPEPGVVPPGGVTVGPGDAFRIYANLEFPGAGIPLFEDVFLTRIGAGVAYPPLRLLGSASITAESIFQIDGALALAFATPTQPYELAQDRDTLGGGFPADAYNFPRNSFTLAISADAYLTVPLVDRIKLANAYFLYQAPGIVRLGGGIHFDAFGVITLDGGVQGDFNFTDGKFNLNGHVDACIADIPLLGNACLGATGNVSDFGAGACVDTGLTSVGGGVIWKPHYEKHIWLFDGCRWSPFADFDVARARDASAAGSYVVRTRRGDRSRELELDGTTSAPRVHVTGANGQTLDSSDGPGLTQTSGIRIARSESLKMTVVGFVNPAAGANTVTLLPGSSPVSHSTIAIDQPKAHVTAAVQGSGSHRTLLYKIRSRTAQRVTFYEDVGGSTRQIGAATGGRGSLGFTATPASRPSTIVARFTLAGLPAERITIARFMPPSPRLPRVRRVRAVRHGTAMEVSWGRVAQAERYAVTATLAVGGQRTIVTRSLSSRLRRIPPWSAGRVTVRALAPMREGPSGGTRFRAHTQRPKTRLKPLVKRGH